MRAILFTAILFCGCCSSPSPLPILPPIIEIPEPTSKSENEAPPKTLTPEQAAQEIAAYQNLLKELSKIEKEVKGKMKTGRSISFLLTKEHKTAMRSGEILLDYIEAVKKDIEDKLRTLRKMI